MSESTFREQCQAVWRFTRFALPHWKLMAVAFAAMTLTSLISGAMLLLTRPIFEGVARESVQSEDATVSFSDQEKPVGESDEGVLSQWERFKGSIEKAILEWKPVAALRDYVSPPDQLKHVAYLILLGIAPLWVIASFLQTYCTQRVLWSVMADLRVAVFEKLSRMPMAFFNQRRRGDLISRLTNDINLTKGAARMLFSDVLKYPVQLAVLLLVALYSSWQLTLVALISVPIIGLVMHRYGNRIQRYGRKSLEKIGDITDAISQMFSGIRVVKAFGMEDRENAEFRKRNQQQLQKAFKLVRNKAWADSIPQVVVVVCLGAVLLLANHLLEQGAIDMSRLIPLVGAVAMMPRSIKRIVKVYSKLREQISAFDRIFELLDEKVRMQDHPDAVKLDGVEESVEFKHVWFAYEDDNFVLRDIDLFVPHGSVCAVVGETGAGKSTLLDLIPRFYDPQRGSVEIDGIDIRHVTRNSLLNQVAIVGQHPFLFNRSVAENIRYGRPDASEEEVRQAARAAGVHELIESLPQGYDTNVGEEGERFSGGQRQCITIARALLKDAPILILDEATSNLDSESEQLVQEAFNTLLQGRTAFVIAHRLSTVRFADRIVALKAGQMVEDGTHEELMEMNGEYAKLYRIQFEKPDRPTGPENPGVRRT